MQDFLEGIGLSSARKFLSILAAGVLGYIGVQLISVRAVLEDSILEIFANGLGWMSLGLALFALAYGFGARSQQPQGNREPCPYCRELIIRTATRCPRCTAGLRLEPCPKCKTRIWANADYCWSCQTEFEVEEAVKA